MADPYAGAAPPVATVDPHAASDPYAAAARSSSDPYAQAARKPATAAPLPEGKYDALIAKHAVENRIDPIVFHKIIETESSFNPRARSIVGAMGLGQLMPETAAALGVKDPFDPDQNLAGAARYLRQRIDHYGGDLTKAIASYNGGDGAVQHAARHGSYRGWGSPANPNETYDYLHTILGYVDHHDTREADFRNAAMRRPAGTPIQRIVGPITGMNKPIVSLAQAAGTHAASDPYAQASSVSDPRLPAPGHIPESAATIPAGYSLTTDPARKAAAAAASASPPGTNYSALDQLSGVVDIPGIIAGGAATNRLGDALVRYVQNPADANAQFGILAKPILEEGVRHHNPTAEWLRDHPVQTGLIAGGLDSFNPVSNAVGGAAGKIIEPLAQLATKVPQVRALLNAFSPFRDIAANAGKPGKRAVQSLMVKLGTNGAKTQAKAISIFGKLSPEEMDDVIHIYQGNTGYVKTTDPARIPELQKRATDLSEYVKSLTQKQVDVKTLKQSVAQDRPTYFPLSGYFARKTNDPETEQFLQELARGGGGSSGITRETTENTFSEHRSLAEAQQHVGSTTYPAGTNARGAPFPERTVPNDPNFNAIKNPDWNPAVALQKWATKREGNVTFEQSVATMPQELRRDITAADFKNPHGASPQIWVSKAGQTESEALQKFIAENHAHFPEGHPQRFELTPPKDGRGKPMVAFERLPQALQNQLVDSPTLRHSWVSRDFATYLQKNSTRLFKAPQMYPTGDDKWNTVARAGLKAWDGYNNAMRAAIISNPLVHPLWNLSNNAYGAGLPLHEVAGLVGRSVFSTFGQGKTVDKVVNFFDKDWAKWVNEATEAGAIAESKIGATDDATRRLAARWQDLGALGRAGKLADTAQAWNNRLTFGPHGEEAFATALYRHMIKSGKFVGREGEQEAAGLVREALGNYQNVDPRAWQSRVIFFYPWLKGNTAFWVRKLATNPKAVVAPQDAARVNNALTGDPSEQQNRAPDFQWRLHDPRGGFDAYTPMIPQRILGEVQGAATGLMSGDPDKMIGAADKVVSSRMQPGIGLGYGAARTGLDERPHDPAEPANYRTMYDKMAPADVKVRQIGAAALEQLAPMPLVGFAVRDAIRTGQMDPVSTAVQSLGLGYIHREVGPEDTQVDSKIRRQFEGEIGKLNAAVRGGAMDKATFAIWQRAYYGVYRATMQYENGMRRLKTANLPPEKARAIEKQLQDAYAEAAASLQREAQSASDALPKAAAAAH